MVSRTVEDQTPPSETGVNRIAEQLKQ